MTYVNGNQNMKRILRIYNTPEERYSQFIRESQGIFELDLECKQCSISFTKFEAQNPRTLIKFATEDELNNIPHENKEWDIIQYMRLT